MKSHLDSTTLPIWNHTFTIYHTAYMESHLYSLLHCLDEITPLPSTALPTWNHTCTVYHTVYMKSHLYRLLHCLHRLTPLHSNALPIWNQTFPIYHTACINTHLYTLTHYLCEITPLLSTECNARKDSTWCEVPVVLKQQMWCHSLRKIIFIQLYQNTIKMFLYFKLNL